MPVHRALNRWVCGLMHRSLRRAFQRVCWVGPPPALPPDVPVVLYANHHSFYDGYLLWLLNARVLRRASTTWMADWDRFPFFAAAGAQPFPPDDPVRRARTVRRTVRQFRRRPDSLLVYFPEGRLHPPEDGILPFDPEAIRRLARLLPEALWWPVALHVTWWGEPRPTALLAGGAPHAGVHGDEAARLEALWTMLRSGRPEAVAPLLEGRPGEHERWSFRGAARFFERFLESPLRE